MGGKPVQAHDVFKKMAFYIGLSHYGVLATTTTLQGGKHLLKNNSHVYHMSLVTELFRYQSKFKGSGLSVQ